MKTIFGLFLIFLISNVMASNNKWVIGLDADMSAVAASGGEAIRRGALIAIDEINAQGGVLGKKIELRVSDHRGNPVRGVDNIIDFAKDENLIAIMGGVHTPVVLAQLETIHNNNIIFLDPWAAGTTIIENGYEPNYVFRVSVRDEHAGSVLSQASLDKGNEKIGLMLERTGWGRSNEVSIKNAAKLKGMNVTTVQWFNWGEKNYDEQIQQIHASAAQSIIFVGNAPEGAEFITQYVESGKKMLPIYSHWGVAGGKFVELVGSELLNKIDITVLQTYSFEEAKSKKAGYVFKRYREKFQFSKGPRQIPSQVGVAHSYDLVHLLALAIKRANSIQPERVRDALESNLQYRGLLKNYSPAFTKDRHDALFLEDYILSKFDEYGFLVPVE